MSMGWVKVSATPGKLSITARSWSASQSLLGWRHSSRGLRTRKVSVWLRPIGSRPSSSEPERATMVFTSGTACSTACCTARSVAMVWARLIEGSFSSCMMMSPSSIVGMKALPSIR